MRRILISALSVSALLLSGTASADPLEAASTEETEAAEEQARAYFKAGAFDMAAVEFLKAYELKPKKAWLFNAALSYENAKLVEKAVLTYGRYLEVQSTGPKAAEARARMHVLKTQKQTTAVSPPMGAASTETQVPSRTPEATEPANKANPEFVGTSTVAPPVQLPPPTRQELAARYQEVASSSLAARDFQAAANAYGSLYELQQGPAYLFSMAEALRVGGFRQQAAAAYHLYRTNHPSGAKMAAAVHHEKTLSPNGLAPIFKAVAPHRGAPLFSNKSKREYGATLATQVFWGSEESVIGLGMGARAFARQSVATSATGKGQLLVFAGAAASTMRAEESTPILEDHFYALELGAMYKFWRSSGHHLGVELSWSPALYLHSELESNINGEMELASSTDLEVRTGRVTFSWQLSYANFSFGARLLPGPRVWAEPVAFGFAF